MAQAGKSEIDIVKEISLIDILYKDEYRVDSYIAQIMNGVLKRRKLQDTNSNNATNDLKFGIKILGANFSDQIQTSNLEEHNLIPHDKNVINLLEILKLNPLEEINKEEEIIGRLVDLRCDVAIRDFKHFHDLMFSLAENPKMFGADEEHANAAKTKSEAMSKVIPVNIEIECTLKDNNIIRGIIKEKYLMMEYQDILAMYGTNLIGKWHVLGILDKAKTDKGYNNEPHSFRQSMDNLLKIAESLYQEGDAKYYITPILIFRGLE